MQQKPPELPEKPVSAAALDCPVRVLARSGSRIASRPLTSRASSRGDRAWTWALWFRRASEVPPGKGERDDAAGSWLSLGHERVPAIESRTAEAYSVGASCPPAGSAGALSPHGPPAHKVPRMTSANAARAPNAATATSPARLVKPVTNAWCAACADCRGRRATPPARRDRSHPTPQSAQARVHVTTRAYRRPAG